MNKKILISLVIFGMASTALGAESTRWPYPKESGRYQVRQLSNNAILWTIDWTTTVTQSSGHAQIQITETGEGKIPKYKQPVKWTKQFSFKESEGGTLSFDEMKSTRSLQSGEFVDASTVTRGSGGISYHDAEKGKKEKQGNFPGGPDVLPDEMLFHWARMVPKEGPLPQPVREALFILSAGRAVTMQARVAKVETVKVPAGEFACYRMELAPKLPGGLKMFAPKMTIWCRQEAPYAWVRYEGPLGGSPGAPRAIIELMEWSHQ